MTFEPADPGFERRARENFSSQGFMRRLGTRDVFCLQGGGSETLCAAALGTQIAVGRP